MQNKDYARTGYLRHEGNNPSKRLAVTNKVCTFAANISFIRKQMYFHNTDPTPNPSPTREGNCSSMNRMALPYKGGELLRYEPHGTPLPCRGGVRGGVSNYSYIKVNYKDLRKRFPERYDKDEESVWTIW